MDGTRGNLVPFLLVISIHGISAILSLRRWYAATGRRMHGHWPIQYLRPRAAQKPLPEEERKVCCSDATRMSGLAVSTLACFWPVFAGNIGW